MNIIDILSGLYVAFGFKRGMKRGLGKEVFKLVNVAIVMISGVGLSKWISTLISVLPGLKGEMSGIGGFVLSVVGAIIVVRLLRNKLRIFLEAKFGQRSGGIAGVIGGVRALIMAILVIAGISVAPVGGVSKPVEEGSFIGRAVNVFLAD